jgi:hypothetical protein
MAFRKPTAWLRVTDAADVTDRFRMGSPPCRAAEIPRLGA